jgi:hypothetical protein
MRRVFSIYRCVTDSVLSMVAPYMIQFKITVGTQPDDYACFDRCDE